MKLPIAGQNSTKPWRSLEELRSPPAPSRELGPAEPPSRRDVLQLLGASAALATLGGCLKPPEEKILPYTKQPPEVTPGNPLHYATASTIDGRATGLLVTSSEGRPTKVEGSPEHPSSRGGVGVFEQAALLGLYDPARLKVVQYKNQPRSWRDFLIAMAAKSRTLRDRKGEGLRFLMEPSSSPLLGHLRQRLIEMYPRARFSAWTAIPLQQIHDGARLAFGSPQETRLDLSQAQVVLSLDADFLSAMPGNARHMRDWAGRRVPPSMARLYQVEAQLSVTGMNADHRLRMKPTQVHRFGLALLGRLASQAPALARHAPLAQRFPLSGDEAKFADALVKDLLRAGRGALVVVGARQPPVLHAAAHAINAALSSAAVSQAEPVLHDMDAGPRALRVLTEEMRQGAVDTAIITAWNPVYGAPFDLNLATALSRVNTSVYRSLYADETADRAGWVIPAAHSLESWGDARAHDGTMTFQQPLISPLYAGVTEVEVLSAFLGEGDRSAYTQLREFWRSRAADDLTWEKWIGDGLVAGTAARAASPAVNHAAILAEAQKVAPAESMPGLEINVIPDYKVYDGRFANNGWLQELPDPVSKLTWENAALLSPATARQLGLEQGDMVDLTLRGPPAHAPVVIVPGHADGAVTVAMGYGRRSQAEALCNGLGFDTASLRHSDSPWFASGLVLVPQGRKELIAQTQEHHSMEGRLIAASTTLGRLRETAEALEEQRGVPLTFHKPWDYSQGYRWGLAIDLSRCTGCSACMVACQSENNVPVVGKERVWRSREMHWLRVDRYFLGEDTGNPAVVFQPLMCVHCESAPCEYVCPVNATVHSDEGLNEMIYNRCVGTRYCSNNCPYKVRRFNFFSYTSDYTDSEKMVFNPDVTVRSRGVMEKCTYCVQRIERARIRSRVEERGIADGEIQTACQQACPAEAIVFGNLNDPAARVSRLLADERRYDLLHELGTRPRTGYLARVTNPNPELG